MHRQWFLICSIVTVIGCVQCDTKSMKTLTTSTAERSIYNNAAATTPFCPAQPECTDNEYDEIEYVADCTKYIYCEPNGGELVIDCASGEEFSPTNKTCMDPELAGCPKCSELVTTSPGDESCSEQPECMPENESGSIPYVADCTKYIYCAPEGPIIIDCPPGEEYSEAEQKCTDPTLANCPKCLTTPSDITTNTQVMTTPHCLEQQECVSPDDDFQTIPYAANCSKYIYCEPDNVSLILDCPDGLHYSPTVNTCVEPELAGCPQCIQATTLPPTTPYCPIQEHCTPETETDTLPYVLDCTKYIYCQLDGSETTMSCPATLHYSPTAHTCVDAEISGCPQCSDADTSTGQDTTTTIKDTTTTIKDTTTTIQDTTTTIKDTTTTGTSSTGTGVTHSSTLPYCPSQPYCTNALEGETLPYIGDCTMYIFCLPDAIEELRYCPDPQEFSPFELKCMAKDVAQCPKC